VPDWWSLGALLLALVAALLIVPVVLLIARRRWLAQRGWVVDCSLRSADTTPGSGWMLGVARFHGDSLEWYRVFSWSLRPGATFTRGAITLSATRHPDESERLTLYGDQRIVDIASERTRASLALSPGDMTAFLSWTEAAPPGEGFR